MVTLSSFEVLAELLLPKMLTPTQPEPLPNVPYIVQSYFVQISSFQGDVSFNLTFQETTNFVQGAGKNALLAQFIDQNGDVNNYDHDLFFNNPSKLIGFTNQQISMGQTKIYSITANVPPVGATDNAAPNVVEQSGTGWRGYANLNITAGQPGALIATPTQRQIYFSGPDLKTVTNSVVYAVPTFITNTTN